MNKKTNVQSEYVSQHSSNEMLAAALSEIDKGNILIAEFDGRKFYAYKNNSSYNKEFDTYKECLEWIGGIKAEKGYAPELGWTLSFGKYHTSWNWLMPVVKKIQQLRIENFSKKKPVMSALMDVDIEILWTAVVAFLKWYAASER